MINVLLIFLQVSANTSALPNGDQGAHWGMTVAELQKTLQVVKATPGSEYGCAHHTEVKPEVFVRKTKDNTRYEYYFYKGRLYKIYIIHSRAKTSPQFYREKVEEAVDKYGSPQRHYQEKVFGMPVMHTLWEDERSILDIRSGAGFIYEVLLDRQIEKQKAQLKQYKKSI